MAEQRYKAVQAVISDGRPVTEVAREWKVSRQTVDRRSPAIHRSAYQIPQCGEALPFVEEDRRRPASPCCWKPWIGEGTRHRLRRRAAQRVMPDGRGEKVNSLLLTSRIRPAR